MDDWLVALIATLGTLGGAVVAAWATLEAAKRQAAIDRQRMVEETKRLERQHEAEMQRLLAQHAEDHLRNRQSTYHQLLDALEGTYLEIPNVIARIESDPPELAREAVRDHHRRLDSAHHLVNGARLFAPATVANHAWSILQLVSKSYLDARAASREGVEVLEPPRIDEFNEAMESLKNAMRADVAPDR